MPTSHLIHNYIDEGLPEIEEQALFAELAADSKTRDEFNRQMKIHLVASKDMNSLAPPAELTAQLFGNLGFASPVGQSQSPPPAAPAKRSYYKYGLLALLFLLSSVGSIVLYDVYSTNSASDSNANSKYSSNESNNSMRLNPNIPFSSSEEYMELNEQNSTSTSSSSNEDDNLFGKSSGLDASKSGLNNNRTYRNSSRSKRAGSTYISDDNSENNSDILQSSETMILPANRTEENYSKLAMNVITQTTFDNAIANRFANHSGNAATFAGSLRGFPLTSIDVFDTNDLPFGETRNEIYITRNAYNSNPDIGLANSSSLLDENITISLRHKISRYQSIGIELSNDHYGQEFSTHIDGQLVTQVQNPQLLSLSALYRLSLPIADLFTPYLQTSIGATSIGPVAKLQLGTSFVIYHSISANVNYTAGALIYNVDNKLYNTINTGFSYGLSYGF